MGETIKVGMADLKVAHAPDSLTTLGLGSCIGLTLYDPVAKVGGLVHFMLPDSTKLKNNTNIENEEKFSPMTLKGKQYNKKEMAGKTILEICKTKENSELEEIGEYRGMKLELQINVARQEFELFLKGRSEYKILLGNDIYGNITRIDNALSNIGKELEENKDELENTKKQFENAKIDVKIPFDKENELKEKSTRLDRVNALLKLDEKESIIMEDDEKSEDDNLKSQDYDKDPIR